MPDLSPDMLSFSPNSTKILALRSEGIKLRPEDAAGRYDPSYALVKDYGTLAKIGGTGVKALWGFGVDCDLNDGTVEFQLSEDDGATWRHFDAGWVAAGAEELWQEHREDGFVIIHAMIDDYRGSGTAGESFREDWSEAYGLTFPVLGEGDINSAALRGLGRARVYETAIPFMILLDQEMRIDQAYTGSGTEGRIESRAEDLLAGE